MLGEGDFTAVCVSVCARPARPKKTDEGRDAVAGEGAHRDLCNLTEHRSPNTRCYVDKLKNKQDK